MENQFTTARVAIALLVASMLTACTAVRTTSVPAAKLRVTQLAITQVGYGPTARYVYCEGENCPSPTFKTPVQTLPALSLQPVVLKTSNRTVDISFPFNSSNISRGDKKLLADAASSFAGGDIEIVARSDFTGPLKARKKVAAARASAMRSIVTKLTQGARIVVRREVAAPTRVAQTEQAQQRKGTVRFIHPIDVQLKGTPK